MISLALKTFWASILYWKSNSDKTVKGEMPVDGIAKTKRLGFGSSCNKCVDAPPIKVCDESMAWSVSLLLMHPGV